MLRTKEQETRLNLHEHDDDDDDECGSKVIVKTNVSLPRPKGLSTRNMCVSHSVCVGHAGLFGRYAD
jgi:hypothetical protein